MQLTAAESNRNTLHFHCFDEGKLFLVLPLVIKDTILVMYVCVTLVQ